MTFEEWWEQYKDTSSAIMGRVEWFVARAAWDAATLLADRPIQLVGVHYNPEEFHEGQP